MKRPPDLATLAHSAFDLFSAAWNRFAWPRNSTESDLEPLLTSDVTARADIEFTTRCNLGCVYCVSRLPSYQGIDLDFAYLDGVAESLRNRKIVTLGVSGHGETTTVRDWHVQCNRLLNMGLDLYLSTNLSRDLSEDEVDTLSRFQVIQVSCDTSDQKLFKELRRGGDFRTLLANMSRIRGRAVQQGVRIPVFWWHCVVSDRTVWKLEEHVGVGLAAGVKMFNFINLAKNPDVKCDEVNLIADMPDDDLKRLPDHFRGIFELIRKNHAHYICDSLLERLTEKLRQPEIGEAEDDGRHFSKQEPGMTRDCIDPWSYIKVQASSALVPCCRAIEAIGMLSDGEPLHQLINNREMREFRRTLLTGRLQNICLSCNIRGWTRIEHLRFKVAMFKRFGKALPALHRSGLLLPLAQRLRQQF
jgi:hypothetical protein